VDGDAAALLARKAAGGDVADLEAAIDGAVCRLFGVGAEEIGMVEGRAVIPCALGILQNIGAMHEKD